MVQNLQSNLDGAESSTPEFLTPASSLAKPSAGSEPRSSEVIAGSGVGKPTAKKESKAGLRAFFVTQKRSAEDALPVGTSQAGFEGFAQQGAVYSGNHNR